MIASEFYALFHDRLFALCCLLPPLFIASSVFSTLARYRETYPIVGVSRSGIYLVWYAALAGYLVWGRAIAERRVNLAVQLGMQKWRAALARAAVFILLMLYASLAYCLICWISFGNDWYLLPDACRSLWVIPLVITGVTAPVLVLNCAASDWQMSALYSVAYLFAVYQIGGNWKSTGVYRIIPICQLMFSAFWSKSLTDLAWELVPSIVMLIVSIAASCIIVQRKDLK